MYADLKGKLKRRVNIEFKYGMATPSAIGKDLNKLIVEGLLGVWFHLLDRESD